MTHFAILLGGRLIDTPRVRKQVAGARVIAADSGIKHADKLQLQPELWVGDFDSSGTLLEARFNHVPRRRYPIDKDSTDGELALQAAEQMGATRATVLGALGGQGDHAFAILMLGIAAARRGVSAVLTSGDEEAHPLLPGVLKIDCGKGERISVLPLTSLGALSIDGVKWPLRNRDVELGSSLTISNEALGPVTIGLQQGHGIVFTYPCE